MWHSGGPLFPALQSARMIFPENLPLMNTDDADSENEIGDFALISGPDHLAILFVAL
jgi:hypothetical protein